MASTERVPFLDELDCRSYFSQKLPSKHSNISLFKISKPLFAVICNRRSMYHMLNHGIGDTALERNLG